MKALPRIGWSMTIAVVFAASLPACGDEGQSIQGECPPLPLYTYKPRPCAAPAPCDPSNTVAIDQSGDSLWDIYAPGSQTPMTQAQVDALNNTLTAAVAANCITPEGHALTLNPVTGQPIPRN